MTRSFSPNGFPTLEVAEYYKKRAEGGVGLILSEGTVVNRPSSSNNPSIPHFYGEEALVGWKKVIDGVHLAGGHMAPQIWHMGVVPAHVSGWLPPKPFEGPSTMSERDIEQTISAFAEAALNAKRLGFNAVEIHGAHGYLVDQFFWQVTNTRSDGYGGKTLSERVRFGVDVVKAIRQAVGDEFAILLRLSQWKLGHYDLKMAPNPLEMEKWLTPLAEAGVDIFHCSQRRFWEPEFEGSDLNFAGWAKKLTGRPTITVGSVGLSGEFTKAFSGESSEARSLDDLINRFEKNEFDLVSVGRAVLSDSHWVEKIKVRRFSELKGFNPDDLQRLL